jgi:ribonuclease T2
MARRSSYNDLLGSRPRRRTRTRSIVGVVSAVIVAGLVKLWHGGWHVFDHDKNASDKSAQNSAQTKNGRVEAPLALPPPAPAVATGSPSNSSAGSPTAQFDFYILALSSAPFFCADGHAKRKECLALSPQSVARMPLTLHGLWPEKNAQGQYPRECEGADMPRLGGTLWTRMKLAMPGTADGLHRHEWMQHGRCSGLTPEAYFDAAITWTEKLNQSVGAALATGGAQALQPANIRQQVAQKDPVLASALQFVCKNLAGKGQTKYLEEVRVCLAKDQSGAVTGPTECAALDRIDQGCGSSFSLALP